MKKQTIFRIEKNNNYVTIDKTFLHNKKLSWKAKGILAYLLSLPDDWKIHLTEIKRHSNDGSTSLYSGINELIKTNHIKRRKRLKHNNQFNGIEYIVKENPHLGNPQAGNQAILNIDSSCEAKNASLRKKKPAALLFDKESSIYKKLLLKLKDNIITKRNLTNYTINFTSWFKEIHKLRKQGISKDRLTQTLKWYIKHYNENYVPVIFNARDFGSKYFKIEDAMSRSNQTNNTPVKTILSKTAKKLINIIKSDHLSLNCVDLDYCVQTSVDNFNQYLKQHSYLQDNTKGRLKAFIKHFDIELPDTKNYLEHWFDKAINKVCNWSDWNGSLKKHIFTIDSREFNNFGCSISTQYCGDNLLWQKYMKALKKGQI